MPGPKPVKWAVMGIPRTDRAAMRNLERAENRAVRDAERAARPPRQPDRDPIEAGTFGMAKVLRTMADGGAWVEAGHPDRVFVPREEQASPLRPESEILVKVLNGDEGRLVASSRLGRHLEPAPADIQGFVDVILWARQGNFWKAVVDNRHLGMVPDPGPVARAGDRRTLRVDRVADGKIYLRLPEGAGEERPRREFDRPDRFRDDRPKGRDFRENREFRPQKGGTFDQQYAILDEIRNSGGFLAYDSGTPDAKVRGKFGVSKSEFDDAVDQLVAKGRMRRDPDGLHVTDRPREQYRPREDAGPRRFDGPPRRFDGPREGGGGYRDGGPPRRFDGNNDRPPRRFDGPPRDGGFREGGFRDGGPPRRFDGPRDGGPPRRFEGGGDRPPRRFDGPRDGGGGGGYRGGGGFRGR